MDAELLSAVSIVHFDTLILNNTAVRSGLKGNNLDMPYMYAVQSDRYLSDNLFRYSVLSSRGNRTFLNYL